MARAVVSARLSLEPRSIPQAASREASKSTHHTHPVPAVLQRLDAGIAAGDLERDRASGKGLLELANPCANQYSRSTGIWQGAAPRQRFRNQIPVLRRSEEHTSELQSL